MADPRMIHWMVLPTEVMGKMRGCGLLRAASVTKRKMGSKSDPLDFFPVFTEGPLLSQGGSTPPANFFPVQNHDGFSTPLKTRAVTSSCK